MSKPDQSLKRNLRIDEVASILNASRRTVYRLVAEGDLQAFKVRNSLRIPREDLEAYMNRQIKKFQDGE